MTNRPYEHCDDIYFHNTYGYPMPVISFLRWARAPADERHKYPNTPLYADHNGMRVRVVMASRFGDVGITPELTREQCYEKRVVFNELSNFSDKE